MPFKLTHVKLYHSTDNGDAIRSEGGLRGTRRDKNNVCGAVGLTKVWCYATPDGCGCYSHGDEVFHVSAADLKIHICNGHWQSYRTRRFFTGYRNEGKVKGHVFYNFFLVPSNTQLTRAQQNTFFHADLKDDDPVQLYWNDGNMYILENEDSDYYYYDANETRHFHVAIVADFIPLSRLILSDEDTTTTTTEEEDADEDTTTPTSCDEDETSTTTTTTIEEDDVDTETREEEDENGITLESNIGDKALIPSRRHHPRAAVEALLGQPTSWTSRSLKAELRFELLDSVGTSKNMQRVENAAKRAYAQQYFSQALDLVLAHAKGPNFTDMFMPDDLCDWHRVMMGGTQEDPRAGQFRTTTVARCGTRTFTRPGNVNSAMLCFCNKVFELVCSDGAKPDGDPALYGKAAYLCYHFVRIHPFSDGNGRMARLLLIWALRRCGFPLLVSVCSPGQQRYRFIQCVRNADSSDGSLRCLAELIEEACDEAAARWH